MSAPVSTPTPLEVARLAADALSAGDLDRFAELLHEDATYDILPFGERHGRAAVRDFFEELRGALPDFSLTVESVTGSGRRVALAWRITGTFSGRPFQGFLPNNHAFDTRGIDLMDIDAGRVRFDRVVFDGAEWARQLGLLPSRNSTAERAVRTLFNAKTQLARRRRERRHRTGRGGHGGHG